MRSSLVWVWPTNAVSDPANLLFDVAKFGSRHISRLVRSSTEAERV